MNEQANPMDCSHPNPAPAASPAAAVFDQAALLSRVGGDRNALKIVVGVFVEDCPRLIHAAQQAVQAVDIHTAHRWAHALKGASATVGADALREQAAILDAAAHAQDLAAAQRAVGDLETQFAAFCRDVARILGPTP